MSVTVSVEGFAQCEQALDNLSKAAGKAALRRALKRSAEPTVKIAQRLAPRLTGKLSLSIMVGAKLDGRQAKLHRRMFRDDRSSVEMFIGPSYLRGDGGRHGHLLEFGTVKMPLQPFMRPAWEEDQKAMLNRLKDDLWAEIQKSILRDQRRAARLAARG